MPRLASSLYLRMLDDAVKAAGGEADGEDEVEPVRLDVNVDAYVPADYVPFEQAKIDIHRRIAGAQEVADVALLREELEDRFGAPPQPVENLLALQEARVKLGRAGARTVSFKGGRLAVTPIDLDSRRAKALREQIPEALFESGKSQVSMRVTDDAEARFPAVVKMADVLLALVSEAAAEEPVAPAAA